MKKVVIIGGGTFEPIRNHLSLAAPAFGSTAKNLYSLLKESLHDKYKVEILLTKMADSNSKLTSNVDVENAVNELLKDNNVAGIVLNVAFCDYAAKVGEVESSFHAERLHTADGPIQVTLTPTDKVIKKIRMSRPDIFLIGFKTTTNADENTQFMTALRMMKGTKCNLVLANDTANRRNMILTPEETAYSITTDREQVLSELAKMISMRIGLTYNRSNHITSESFDIKQTSPKSFQKVVDFLINNGGFIENNGNGFTPGHFCYRSGKTQFFSSQRKADHRLVFTEGWSKVDVNQDEFIVTGKRKASVGARSQWLMLTKHPEYDCIIHTHNPLKLGSMIPVASQKPFQCGSLECGMNTVNNLGDFGIAKAVYLDKHGANIVFKSTEDPDKVIDFIKNNIELGIKTT